MADEPDPGKLSQEDQQKALAWLDRHWRHPRKCPVCESEQWSMGDRVVAPPNLHGGSFHLAGFVYPFVTVGCKTCGYTRFFNAMKMGVISKKEDSGAS